ncbi:ABC transporter permease [Larkinella terrae]|uniref:FtsX-like permease family protein n=1 Tax=Larkinella terrae TaxID=2025311 RepID=A0A7K0EQZ1_9BACT|nr:ABC transporter permease [Larkinella terrae]MRS64217.1 FtsX-like permease family protein [Larkinella terrae]
MLRNYLKIAFRNLLKHKTFGFINIVGVAIGLACFLLIALYVRDEISFDRYNAKADRTYRVLRTFLNSNDGTVELKLGTVAPPFGPLIKQDFPQAEEVVRTLGTNSLLKYGEHTYNENKVLFAEENIFKVLDFKVISGDPAKALARPFSIMLSRPMAEKYFGKESPMGKSLKSNNQFELMVTGVFEPLPAQSHIHPDFLVSFTTLNDNRVYGAEGLRTNWGNNSFLTYVLLAPGTDPAKLVKAFPAFQNRRIEPKASTYSVLNLQKLTDVHLRSDTDDALEADGDIRYVYMFSAIGLFILLIACINYMNLATARSAGRAKEVGMRKVVGAHRGQLVSQFLSESILLVVFALSLALILVVLCLPFLNDFTQKQLTLVQLKHPVFLGIVAGITLLTGLVSGSYPAFFLTSFQPISVLKGKIASAMRTGRFRQALVVTQFAIAVALIISTIVVYNQMDFIRNYKLGYQKDQIVLLRTVDDSTTNSEALKQELKSNSAVLEVGLSSRIPSGRLLDSWDAYVAKGDSMAPSKVILKALSIDHDFIPAYSMKMAAGRNFSRAYTTDDTAAFIINETAARMLGWKNPEQAIGKPFGYGQRRGQVVGVTKDFHFESLRQAIPPIAMFMLPERNGWISIRVAGGTGLQTALTHIESVWKRRFSNQPFSYEFLDQRFGRLYTTEQTQQKLFGIFAGIAILISCLGLFGLSMFMAEQRTKEIGIRKVLGASTPGLVALLSKDLLKLVLIALVLASPVAWWAMSQWLEGFVYRTSISPWVFILTAVIAIAIAFATVSFQSIKAALMNPVKSLKTE